MWELGFLEVSVRLNNEFRWEAEGVESDMAAIRLSLALRRGDEEVRLLWVVEDVQSRANYG